MGIYIKIIPTRPDLFFIWGRKYKKFPIYPQSLFFTNNFLKKYLKLDVTD